MVMKMSGKIKKKSVLPCKRFFVSLLKEVRLYPVNCKKLIPGKETPLATFVIRELSASGFTIDCYKISEILRAL